jgi:hypothetical protein
MALKNFLSKTTRMVSSNFDNTQGSEPYASTDLIKFFYNLILFIQKYKFTCCFVRVLNLVALTEGET